MLKTKILYLRYDDDNNDCNNSNHNDSGGCTLELNKKYASFKNAC